MTTSIATGAALTPETWADFVTRLKHDCRGEGVRDHCTADAIFIVQAKCYTYGIDLNYDPERVICLDDTVWLDPQAYWDDCSEDDRISLNETALARFDNSDFLALDKDDQFEILDDMDGHSVVGRAEHWEYVCAHFTNDAAEAFIRRKAHDYRDGLRVYVEAQSYSWEYNTIKAAIMDGRLTLADKGEAA